MVNVARFLPECAQRSSDQCAVKVPIGRNAVGICYLERSFSELEKDACACAHWFSEHGVARGVRVLLMVRPGLELIVATFALFKIGAVPIVIDPGMGLKSFLNCVQRSRPEVLVGVPVAFVVSGLFFSKFSSLKRRLVVREGMPKMKAYQKHGVFDQAQTGESDLAAILFTSGSTGAPKGVCYTHGMFEAQVKMIREHYDIEPGEVDLPMLPIFALFNPALGMTTVVPEMNPSRPAQVDPAKIVQAIQQCQVTSSFGSPVLWRKIGDYCIDHKISLPSIRRILMAGASVPPDLLEIFRKIIPEGVVHCPYGATEALPVSSINMCEVLKETALQTQRGVGSCLGKVLPGNEVRIIEVKDESIKDWDGLGFCGIDRVGEIIVSGPSVTIEYDQLPDATHAAKVRDNEGRVWHRMGDLGYLDREGKLWFCGRKVERVQTKDATYYTDCCEAIFNQHPRVYRSALIGLGDRGNQNPAIVVEPKPSCYPRSRNEKNHFIEELIGLAENQEHTSSIKQFFFCKHFPVDVRHNAKIHRLSLAKNFFRTHYV